MKCPNPRAIGISIALCIAMLAPSFLFQASTKSSEAQVPTTDPLSDLPPFDLDLVRIHKAAETESIRATAEMLRVVSFGKPIEIELHLINNRKQIIDCGHDVDERDFFLKLLDSDGKAVVRTEYGRHHMVDPYTFLTNIGLRIKPGEQMISTYDIAKYFQIPKPGKYRLDVLKPNVSILGMKEDGVDLALNLDSIIFYVK